MTVFAGATRPMGAPTAPLVADRIVRGTFDHATLASMKVADLRAVAESLSVDAPSKATKSQLIELIEQAQEV